MKDFNVFGIFGLNPRLSIFSKIIIINIFYLTFFFNNNPNFMVNKSFY